MGRSVLSYGAEQNFWIWFFKGTLKFVGKRLNLVISFGFLKIRNLFILQKIEKRVNLVHLVCGLWLLASTFTTLSKMSSTDKNKLTNYHFSNGVCCPENFDVIYAIKSQNQWSCFVKFNWTKSIKEKRNSIEKGINRIIDCLKISIFCLLKH